MMNDDIWKQCTNAVERKNLDSKESLPQAIQAALINMYKYDKAACAKHVAAKEGISVSYGETSLNAASNKTCIRQRNDTSYIKWFSTNHQTGSAIFKNLQIAQDLLLLRVQEASIST